MELWGHGSMHFTFSWPLPRSSLKGPAADTHPCHFFPKALKSFETLVNLSMDCSYSFRDTRELRIRWKLRPFSPEKCTLAHTHNTRLTYCAGWEERVACLSKAPSPAPRALVLILSKIRLLGSSLNIQTEFQKRLKIVQPIFKTLFIYLASLCGMQDLSSLTRGWTWASCIGSVES